MRLTFLQTLSGPACLYLAGSTYEVPDAEGVRLVTAGVAEDAAKVKEGEEAPAPRGSLRVQMLQTMAGPSGAWLQGRHYVLPMDQAERLVAAGIAVLPGKAGTGQVPPTPATKPPARRRRPAAPAETTAAPAAPETTAAPPAAETTEDEAPELPELPTTIKDLRDLWMAEVGPTVPMPKGQKGQPTVASLTEGLQKHRAARRA